MAFDMEGSMLVERKVDAVTYVNIAYPLVMLSLSLLSLFCFLMGKSPSNCSISERRSYLLKSVSPLLIAAFVTEGVLYHVQSRLDNRFSLPPWATEYILSSATLWACFSIALIESKSPFWAVYIGVWVITGLFDSVRLSLQAPVVSHDVSKLHLARFIIQVLRVCICTVAVLYAACVLRRDSAFDESKCHEETQSLLASRQGSIHDTVDQIQSPVAYGPVNNLSCEEEDTIDEEAFGEGTDSDDDGEDKEEQEIKHLQEQRVQEQGWFGYLKGFMIFLPYILPYKDRAAQIWLLVMIFCIAVDRVLVLMIPRQLGILIDALARSSNTGELPWKEFLTWVLLRFPLEIVLNATEDMARTRVSQFAKYQLNSLAFSHVMSLSMDYHTSKSTGKVITAIEQGTDLTYLVDTLFEVGPMIIDLLVAVIYLTKHFDSTVGFIVLIAAVFNAYVTWKGNKYTSKMERQFVDNSQRQNTVLYDSISNWFTVVIHNRAKFEHQRFSQAVWKNLLTERRYYDASEVLWKSQEVLLDLGLYASCYVAAIRVVEGHSTISSFVFLTSYWDSITSPMSSLAHQFHETAAHLIRAEWLYQLLQTNPSVRDKTDARQLNISEGRVTFENVSFSYNPQRTILDNISFATEPGQAIALVGETGSGKSTILKLLWRFYDVTSGRICIDGQDIRDITLDSLRDSLGSVPQDPSVFDQTIMQNLLYARPLATEQDVFDACKAACIHDQIMSFPDGYQSKIGERGVRLSGGELQRLAIARVMIRRPQIVVLDEATSAVDSDTEANVQRAIKALSAGRTVFTVAHRLSTVVAADKILVIHKGEIVEQGTHHGLLVANGRYARLWAIQTASQETDRLVDDSVSG